MLGLIIVEALIVLMAVVLWIDTGRRQRSGRS